MIGGIPSLDVFLLNKKLIRFWFSAYCALRPYSQVQTSRLFPKDITYLAFHHLSIHSWGSLFKFFRKCKPICSTCTVIGSDEPTARSGAQKNQNSRWAINEVLIRHGCRPRRMDDTGWSRWVLVLIDSWKKFGHALEGPNVMNGSHMVDRSEANETN